METQSEAGESPQKKSNTEFVVQVIFIAVLALLLVYQWGKLSSGSQDTIVSGAANAVASAGIPLASAAEILPKGVPTVYGEELKVKYDDVSTSNPGLADTTMQKLAQYEDNALTSEQMQRYVRIGSSIACEYCCGAKTLVFSNGERACGCAHSYAMRGLAKYLLTKHADMSDEAILSELGKWKVLFFPGIHAQKAEALKAQGIDATDYTNLASNKYRGIEQGAAQGEMVGGC